MSIVESEVDEAGASRRRAPARREAGGPPAALAGSLGQVKAAIEQLKALRTFVREEMVEGVDFGTIPGTGPKPTLLLPGAQKTALYFNVTARLRHRRTDLGAGHLEVESRCLLVPRGGGPAVAMGDGSCSTMESKYRWRQAEKTCPACGRATIIKGREEYGGGWVCLSKKGGCGAKYRDDDQRVSGQRSGRVENPDIWDARNTVLKIAAKRAQVAAALNLGAMAELFTQDLEDIYDLHAAPPAAAPAPEPAPAPAPAAPERPARKAPSKAWDDWATPLAKRAEADWQTEMEDDQVDEGIRRDRDYQLCSFWSLTNALVTSALEAEPPLFKPSLVAKADDPTKRDRARALEAARWLFEQHGRWARDEVQRHLEEKRADRRRKLNMPGPADPHDVELPPEAAQEANEG